MVNQFVENHFLLLKSFNEDPQNGFYENTKNGLIRKIFYFYVLSLFITLLSLIFRLPVQVQTVLVSLVIFLLITLFIVEQYNKKYIEAFQNKRIAYFVKKYNKDLFLIKYSDEIECNCMCGCNKQTIHLEENNQIKEVSILIKELATKSQKKYTLNFSFLPLLLTAMIAWINFSGYEQPILVYTLSILLILCLFISISLIYRIIEKKMNIRSKKLEELYYILNEVQLLKLLNSSIKEEEKRVS